MARSPLDSLHTEHPFDLRGDLPIKMKIQDLDGTIKNIQFYPEGKNTFDVPQYLFDENYYNAHKDECLQWFGVK